MRLLVVAPGRIEHPGARALIDDYAARLTPLLPAERVIVKTSRRTRATEDQATRAESAALLAACPPGAWRVALDLEGRPLDSDAFLEFVRRRQDTGTRALAFLVGGPSGLTRELVAACESRLCLSRMTLPHELAEVVLWEQIYRVATRLRGLPYHR